MTRAIQFAFFALALCFTTPNLHAQRLHTVAVGDLSPSAGWGKYTAAVAMDLTNVWILVSENMPERGMDFSRLEIDEDQYSSPAHILDAVQRINVQPNDSILFYFSGHGAVDDNGHYLALSQGKLYRKDLLDALMKKNAKMVALITDCCNTRSDGYLYAAPGVRVSQPAKPTPLFRKLFFETAGVVDINSSSPGESAFFAPMEKEPFSPGSIFSLAWLNWTQKEKGNSRSWDELVRGVGLIVHKSFHDYYPKGASIAKGAPIQTDQSIFAFTYPDMPAAEGPRTGMLVRDFPGRGAVITQVSAKSPASQVFLIHDDRFVSLKPQQVVVSVNGTPTPDTETVVQEIKSSPQIVRLAIRDASTGTFEALMRMKY